MKSAYPLYTLKEKDMFVKGFKSLYFISWTLNYGDLMIIEGKVVVKQLNCHQQLRKSYNETVKIWSNVTATKP